MLTSEYQARYQLPYPHTLRTLPFRNRYLSRNKYDHYITTNIIIIDLRNASANNSILEMIVTETPFFVNRLSSVEEYLGTDYPLYFSNATEIEEIINYPNIMIDKYTEAHQYLRKLDKSDITHQHFNSELLRLINL